MGRPNLILFVEDLTGLVSESLPDFWRLGQAYFSSALFQVCACVWGAGGACMHVYVCACVCMVHLHVSTVTTSLPSLSVQMISFCDLGCVRVK